MPVTSGPQIGLNEIHVEAGGSSSTQASQNDSDIRGLIGKASSTQSALTEWYGASAAPSFVGRVSHQRSGTPAAFTMNLTGQGIQAGDLVVFVMAPSNGRVNMGTGFSYSGMSLTLHTAWNINTSENRPGTIMAYGFWQSGNSNLTINLSTFSNLSVNGILHAEALIFRGATALYSQTDAYNDMDNAQTGLTLAGPSSGPCVSVYFCAESYRSSPGSTNVPTASSNYTRYAQYGDAVQKRTTYRGTLGIQYRIYNPGGNVTTGPFGNTNLQTSDKYYWVNGAMVFT